MTRFGISQRRTGLLLLLLPLGLIGFSNAEPETIPKVKILDNDSGIEVGSIEIHGPTYLIGSEQIWHPDPPNISTGVSVNLQTNNEDRQKRTGTIRKTTDELQVVSIERIGKYDTKSYNFTNCLEKWREILEAPDLNESATRVFLYKEQLSEIPWINAGRCFHGKLRVRTFPWGKAVLFLTTYVQGSTGGLNSGNLFLVAQGVTNDGRYAVNARFDISHSKLPKTVRDKGRGKVRFSVDTEIKEAEQWLDSQTDNSFSPTFGQYEEFLSSLEIIPGKKMLKREKAFRRVFMSWKKTG